MQLKIARVWLSLLLLITLAVVGCVPVATPAAQPAAPAEEVSAEEAPAEEAAEEEAPAEEASAGEPEQLNLVIYTAFVDERMQPLVSLFKEWALETHNADVNVEWIYASTGDNFARFQAEQENPQASILTTTGDRAMAAKAMGLTEPYMVSNWDSVPDFAKDSEGHWWAPSLLPNIILYNTDVVSEEEAPRDWPDVLDPKWKGQIIVRDPTQSGTGGTIVLSFMAVYGPEQGKDFLLRLDDQVEGRYHESSTETVLDVGRGAYAMALWNEAFTLRQKYDEGFSNLGVIYPESWMTMGLEARLIPKGAPDRRAAELWMEFESTPLAAADMMAQYDRPTLSALVPDDQAPDWLKSSQDLPVLNIDWAKFSEVSAEWLTMWTNEIKGRGADYVAANPEVPTYEIVDDFLITE